MGIQRVQKVVYGVEGPWQWGFKNGIVGDDPFSKICGCVMQLRHRIKAIIESIDHPILLAELRVALCGNAFARENIVHAFADPNGLFEAADNAAISIDAYRRLLGAQEFVEPLNFFRKGREECSVSTKTFECVVDGAQEVKIALSKIVRNFEGRSRCAVSGWFHDFLIIAPKAQLSSLNIFSPRRVRVNPGAICGEFASLRFAQFTFSSGAP